MGRRPNTYELNVNMTQEQGALLKARAKAERRTITAVVLAALFPDDAPEPADP